MPATLVTPAASPVTTQPGGLLRFGRFEVDLASGELRREGVVVKLQQQPFKVLARLASEPGRLHTREQLRQLLWGEDTFVDFEQGVNYCVKQVRAALGDDAERPLYVETLPRRGYRFIAPVEPLGSAQPSAVASAPAERGTAAAQAAVATGRDARTLALRHVWIRGALAVLAVATLSISVWLVRERPWAAAGVHALQRPMLVVLPFRSVTAEKATDSFTQGLTEELIAQLGRAAPARLGVIARSSAMRYESADPTLEQLGAELGVDYVVEGGVRREGERVRITVSLVQVKDHGQVWAETYDRLARDVLGLQAEVARAVTGSIRVALTPQAADRLQRTLPEHPEAHEAYLRGRHFWNMRNKESLRRSIGYFERAVELQPSYALAWVGLADAQLVLADHGYVPAAEVRQSATRAAERGLALDPELAEAHTTLAMIRAVFDWDWQGAEAGFEKAIALNTNYATAYHWYSHCLRAQGRVDEAVTQMELALRLDPLSLMINTNLGTALLYAGRLTESEARHRRTLELDPDWQRARWGLARALLRLGHHAEAIASLEAARQPAPSTEYLANLTYAHAVAGRTADARRTATALEALVRDGYVPALHRAIAQAAIGEKARAVEHVGTAFAARDSSLRLLNVDERLRVLRSEPRIQQILREMGLRAASGE